jgi:hypothetical protein
MCGILALFGAPDANGDLRANLLALSKVGLKLSVHTPSIKMHFLLVFLTFGLNSKAPKSLTQSFRIRFRI